MTQKIHALNIWIELYVHSSEGNILGVATLKTLGETIASGVFYAHSYTDRNTLYMLEH